MNNLKLISSYQNKAELLAVRHHGDTITISTQPAGSELPSSQIVLLRREQVRELADWLVGPNKIDWKSWE
jgi:hypothetical protein